jgi:hypothetical protein
VRRGLALALLVGALLVVGLGLWRTWLSLDELNEAQQRRTAGAQSARYACLERSLRTQIPSGAAVVNAGADTLDRQRIIEELTPGYRFVGSPRPGAYVVTFTRPGPCGGQAATVHRVP